MIMHPSVYYAIPATNSLLLCILSHGEAQEYLPIERARKCENGWVWMQQQQSIRVLPLPGHTPCPSSLEAY